ncbi:MAG: AAA family ATPase [Nanoarchaeota archaeon]|nr:AAA family ATPase [Nanoarchaeota archaeon]MBU1632861.1 AAA family ATPase [Nanoarchaeota archaeon]MBU1876667.1 AAA family ATPase [Nanoarchaeota archaeon]
MSNIVISISGSPATGKSKLAGLLAKELHFSRLDLHDHYKDISIGYNRSKQCYDVDLKKFEKLVKEKVKKVEKGLIVDSHIAHLLPQKLVDLCIIITCSDLKKLERRLKKKKYSKKKIRENLDAEIFQVCLNEAKEKGHKVITFDTSKINKKEDITKKIRISLDI